jgi:hypothetical protein
MNNTNKLDFYTEKELSEILKLSPKTLRHWRWQKQGPSYYKFGRLVRYKIEEVNKYIQESSQIKE